MVVIAKFFSTSFLLAATVAALPGGKYDDTYDSDHSYKIRASCAGQSFHDKNIEACGEYGLCIGRKPTPRYSSKDKKYDDKYDDKYDNNKYNTNKYDNNKYDNNKYDNNKYDNKYDNNKYDTNKYDNNKYDDKYDNNKYDTNKYDNNKYDNNKYDNNKYDNKNDNKYDNKNDDKYDNKYDNKYDTNKYDNNKYDDSTSYKFYKDRGFSLDVSNKGGQRVYCRKDGWFSYAKADCKDKYDSYNFGNAYLGPRRSNGWRDVKTGYGKKFLACPIYEGKNKYKPSFYQVVYGIPNLRDSKTCKIKDCVAFQPYAIQNPSYGKDYKQADRYD